MKLPEMKRILVGVSGGIAAYKTPILVRRLVEQGHQVRVVMTDAAREFVTPLTLQAVSGHAVSQSLLKADSESAMEHIQLARWAQQIIIAPATANCIAKLAAGCADDLLSATVLASEAEIVVAPAMNLQMWRHPATQRNLQSLLSMKVRVLGPVDGKQACNESGAGRMMAPEEIAIKLSGEVTERLLEGVETLITAGPTWEAVDPIRGISNRSSGKMGYAMAQAARDSGASVTLISGPVKQETPYGVQRIDVVCAEQMSAAVIQKAPHSQLFIAVAAVADYRPVRFAQQKIKSASNQRMTIELVKNRDILAEVAALAKPPYTLGFAAETENVAANARQKLLAKGIDAIAANHVDVTDTVFGSDLNAVTLLCKNGSNDEISQTILGKADKYQIAVQIIQHVAPLLAVKHAV